mgnify:CR=1 FL=1
METPLPDEVVQHPLVLRLLVHAENPFNIYTEAEDDIKAAAELLQDQHNGISEALEAYLDQDLQTCERILMRISNEHPFKSNETTG